MSAKESRENRLAKETIMDGVREYEWEMPIHLAQTDDGRLVIEAFSEGGWSGTQVDLLDLLRWLAENRPDLLKAEK